MTESSTIYTTQTRTMAQAFNEWMRRYTDEPDRFDAEFKTCGEFLAQDARGEEPSYGTVCAAYLANLMTEEPPRAGTLQAIHPEGSTAWRADGSEIKIGDVIAPGEKVTVKTARDGVYSPPGSIDVALP